ncbi:MAG: hypothetical protein ACKO5F_15430 [Synechococcus sp.]
MVESPAKSGRMRTLIHPGPIAGVHVKSISREILDKEVIEGDTLKSLLSESRMPEEALSGA